MAPSSPETRITNDLEEIIEFRDIFLTGKHKNLLDLGFITLLSFEVITRETFFV